MALLHCELRYGAAWMHAPTRWGTSDGYPPIYLVFPYFYALRMGRTTDALDTARGISLAFGSEDAGRRALQAAHDEAFPVAEDVAPSVGEGGIDG